MGARRVIIVVVAGALGLWVAIAAAQGGLDGGSSSGTGTYSGTGFPCPSTTVGSTTYGCPPHHPGGFGGGGSGHGQAGGSSGQATGGEGGVGPGEGEGGEGAGEVVHGPRFAGRRLTFTFLVRLHNAPGTASALISGYSAHIVPPRGAPASCQPRLIRVDTSGRTGQVARVHVKPPLGGWCGGRYRVTVALNHGP